MEKEKYIEMITKYSGKSSRDAFGSMLIEKAEKDAEDPSYRRYWTDRG